MNVAGGMTWRARAGAHWRLARFDRPAGILLLLWPTLWGLWLGSGGAPSGKWLAVFSAGVLVMRAFGCIVNDIADIKLDAVVARTRGRPLAAGELRRPEAAAAAAAFLAVAFALWWLLPFAARLCALAAVALALLYPFCKRFMAMPQLALAAAFGMGIVVADAAARAAAPSLAAWLFYAGNFMWIVAYDTIYAMADREDDARHGGVGSSALLFGRRDVSAVSLLYAACLVWLCGVGVYLNYGIAYQVALMAATVCAMKFWQKYKTRNAEACMAAFRANHWFGLFVFAGIAAEWA